MASGSNCSSLRMILPGQASPALFKDKNSCDAQQHLPAADRSASQIEGPCLGSFTLLTLSSRCSQDCSGAGLARKILIKP